MYGLPSTVAVNQLLPKTAFYQRLPLAASVKDEFVHGIEELRVIASVKEATCGIPASGGVEEISVLRIALKTDELPRKALDAIASAVPRVSCRGARRAACQRAMDCRRTNEY